jgi:hypothetical protein
MHRELSPRGGVAVKIAPRELPPGLVGQVRLLQLSRNRHGRGNSPDRMSHRAPDRRLGLDGQRSRVSAMTPLIASIFDLAPAAVKAMMQLEVSVRASGLGTRLLELVKLRASQISGCAPARRDGDAEHDAAGLGGAGLDPPPTCPGSSPGSASTR